MKELAEIERIQETKEHKAKMRSLMVQIAKENVKRLTNQDIHTDYNSHIKIESICITRGQDQYFTFHKNENPNEINLENPEEEEKK